MITTWRSGFVAENRPVLGRVGSIPRSPSNCRREAYASKAVQKQRSLLDEAAAATGLSEDQTRSCRSSSASIPLSKRSNYLQVDRPNPRGCCMSNYKKDSDAI